MDSLLSFSPSAAAATGMHVYRGGFGPTAAALYPSSIVSPVGLPSSSVKAPPHPPVLLPPLAPHHPTPFAIHHLLGLGSSSDPSRQSPASIFDPSRSFGECPSSIPGSFLDVYPPRSKLPLSHHHLLHHPPHTTSTSLCSTTCSSSTTIDRNPPITWHHNFADPHPHPLPSLPPPPHTFPVASASSSTSSASSSGASSSMHDAARSFSAWSRNLFAFSAAAVAAAGHHHQQHSHHHHHHHHPSETMLGFGGNGPPTRADLLASINHDDTDANSGQ